MTRLANSGEHRWTKAAGKASKGKTGGAPDEPGTLGLPSIGGAKAELKTTRGTKSGGRKKTSHKHRRRHGHGHSHGGAADDGGDGNGNDEPCKAGGNGGDEVTDEEQLEHEDERSDSSGSSSSSSEEDEGTNKQQEEQKDEKVKVGGFFLLRRHRMRKEAKRRASLSHQPVKREQSEEHDDGMTPVGSKKKSKKQAVSAEFSPISSSSSSSSSSPSSLSSSPSSPSAPRRRKNSLGSFGYGVVHAGRRRAVTDTDLVVITERADVDVPESAAERIEAAVTRWKGGGIGQEALAASVRAEKKMSKGEEDHGKDVDNKRRKQNLRNLSKSAPTRNPIPLILSDDDVDEGDDDDDNDNDDDHDEDGDTDEDEDEEENGEETQPPRVYRERSQSRDESSSNDLTHVDVTLLEAKNLLMLNKRAMRKLFKYKLFAPSFTISVSGNTARTKRTTSSSPSYNHQLTFSYREQDDEILSVKLFYCYRNKPHRIRRLHVGTAEILLNELSEDRSHDKWLSITPTRDYQMLWDWQKPRKNESPRLATKSVDRSRVRLGTVHLLIHKSANPKAGALSTLGIPSLAVPLRLKVGDVILFHCSQFASHGAKLATRSRWDHVAMVAKHRQREGLYLFEATRDGVHLFHLDRRLAFYLESRTELGVRRLLTERTAEMKEALHDFIAEVEGRPYKTNPIELLRALRDSNENDNLDTIFCSQLVAAAYQRMGVLSMDLCSNNYLPADFATSKIEEHMIGAELGHLVMVPPVLQKGQLSSGGIGGSAGSGPGSAAGSAPGSFQIGSFPVF